MPKRVGAHPPVVGHSLGHQIGIVLLELIVILHAQSRISPACSHDVHCTLTHINLKIACRLYLHIIRVSLSWGARQKRSICARLPPAL